ncbi:MAG: flavin oxidoreductase/NADH oxidase [Defluviitaleaceae bacterium]|nr:flavin oxidoreductase/NADH oxidase [Defluviitaleaceae bacterium]
MEKGKHSKFNYKSLKELQTDIDALGLDLGCDEDLSILSNPVRLGIHTAPNALVAHPMEGGDSDDLGGPSYLTFRKYERAAAGGSGLIWLESVSVNHEGRSNKRQLFINEKSLPGFKYLANRIYKHGNPITIVQLNHSGRYSKPDGPSAPMIASHKPELDERLKIAPDHELITDNYLDSLIDDFVKAALLVKEAGFHGVDIKACHGYLLHELLSCFDREGKYGGIFENRSALMLTIIDKVREAIPDPSFIIASRLNLYDAMPISKGWGQDSEDYKKVDLTEPIKLAKELVKRNVTLINITMGNPYYIPHINRPYDLGAYYPDEAPLEGVYRLIHYTREMQKAVPEGKFVGVGYSWLRQFSPQVAAWILKTGGAAMIGYGRQFIAYPEYANDIIKNGELDRQKVCISCSKCSMLKRDAGTCGCVVRDQEAYLQLYKETYQ